MRSAAAWSRTCAQPADLAGPVEREAARAVHGRSGLLDQVTGEPDAGVGHVHEQVVVRREQAIECGDVIAAVLRPRRAARPVSAFGRIGLADRGRDRLAFGHSSTRDRAAARVHGRKEDRGAGTAVPAPSLPMARVAELICYPIKGCAGTVVPEAVLTRAGIAHDRSFMVIGADGVFRSQRRSPQMALIHPEVSAGGELLTLRAPGVDALRADVDLTAARRDVEMFGAPYQGIDQGDAVGGWLSEVLGVTSRLVRVPPEYDRVTSGETPGTAGYADSSALLLTSLSSLDGLNARIAERGGEPLPMSRFRPNIVVRGWEEAHTEDRARRIHVGDAELAYAKLAVRCVVTTVDQESGTKSGPEPLRTLADYRRTADGGVAFGVRFAVVRPGRLSVGDEVAVGAWAESEIEPAAVRPSRA
jgi:uncharacterized protein YcbX